MTREQAVKNLVAAARYALVYWADAYDMSEKAGEVWHRLLNAMVDLRRSRRKRAK